METPPPSAASSSLSPAECRAALRRVTWRLMPLLFFCYIIAYIDRINVGFAKLQLGSALGIDPLHFEQIYGLGAGLFFIGYFLFEVPSNLILHRVGARLWIARIMILWGLVSIAFMFVKSVPMFYALRFLLGAAEAGFFPGVVLYLTYWYPAQERARMVAWFALGGIAAGVIGSPLSGWLLSFDGHSGLHGWQWLFLLEGIPAVLTGLGILLLLPNGPAAVAWLSEREKTWLTCCIAEENEKAGTGGAGEAKHSLKDAFTHPLVWLLCALYFLLNVGGYGFEMWSPTILKNFSGSSDQAVSYINMIPYFLAGVVMIWAGRHSDRTGERRMHIAFGALAGAIGFAISASVANPYLAMGGLTLGFIGVKAMLGPFWALGSSLLTGTAAAGGIALINSVGNLGGFAGPYLVGLIKSTTHSNVLALWVLAGGLFLLFTLATLLLPRKGKQDHG